MHASLRAGLASSLLLLAGTVAAVPLVAVQETQIVTVTQVVTAGAPAPAAQTAVAPAPAPAPAAPAPAPAAPAPVFHKSHGKHHGHLHKGAAPKPAPVAGGASGPKRGLAFNDAALTNIFSKSPLVGWAYNWASSTSAIAPGLEYVPMMWGQKAVSYWASDANSAIQSGSKHLLGFNEPDMSSQAALDPSSAAALWRSQMEPFAGKALLGSPAVTSTEGDANMGLGWLSQFMSACSGCNVDFVALHWYGNYDQASNFKQHIQQAYSQFKKPIWITEIGASGDDGQVQSFLQEVLPWLDSQSYVQRYAYFYTSEGYLVSGGGMSSYGKVFADFTR